nr:hypothetical protein BaRGS_004507 [Batillaria attramentaria]
MITIKNRIKIPDARAKIIQKRLQKGNFDARSKLKPKAAQGNQNQKGMKKVSVNTSRAPGPGSAPTLTRTLMNPLAAGGALVEDTGSSLKITRSIPDVTFDGGSLTITRRLPPSGPNQEASQFASSGQRVNMDRDKGPVIQIRNEKFRPQPVQAPGGSVKSRPTASPAMGARSYSQPQAAVSTRPPAKLATRSPIQLPVRTPVQSPSQAPVQHPQRTSVQSAPSASAFSGNSRYKYTSTAASARTETSLESQGRLKPPPVVEAARRPAQSALSRIQMQAQADTTQTRGVSPRQPAMKRLAPASSYQAYEHTADVEVSTTQRAGVKRRAPLSLSDRFASGGGGNPIPVITDHAPKKRRTPAPVPVEPMEEFVEDFEKEQFEEQEEDPAPTLLSPLQGFCILVSNLHSSVTQDDIIELFAAIGPLKRANLLQRGQAEVAFIHREHAIMALKKYHNRELDGQPMFVKLVTPINAKVMKTPATAEENAPALPPSLK